MRRVQGAMAMIVVVMAGACTSAPEERAVDSRISAADNGSGSTPTTTSSTTQPDQGNEGESSEDGRIVESGTYSCDDHPDILIPGSHLEVTLTGSCASVGLEGSGHDVEIESVDLLTITGANQEVEISGAASQVGLEGANHDVRYPAEAGTTVDDQSTNSQVEAG